MLTYFKSGINYQKLIVTYTFTNLDVNSFAFVKNKKDKVLIYNKNNIIINTYSSIYSAAYKKYNLFFIVLL